MTQEQKDLLLKDLCARLPYGVIVNVKGFDYDYNDKLTQIYKGVGCSIQVTTNMPYDIEQVKPYLFPLSIMTKEQKDTIDLIASNSNTPLSDVVDFYNKNHLDYRGLIPMGLAEDATGLNIY
jgi:hypothetical protein